jgi:hypothetical protein
MVSLTAIQRWMFRRLTITGNRGKMDKRPGPGAQAEHEMQPVFSLLCNGYFIPCAVLTRPARVGRVQVVGEVWGQP